MKLDKILMMIGLLAVLVMAGCAQQGPTQSPPTGTSQPGGAYGGGTGGAGATGGSGLAVFTIADKAADLGNITSIKLTVDSVQAHGTGGWVTLSSTPMTFDLLQLKASSVQALLAEANLTSGSYDQVRLEVSSVTVTDSSGTHDAKLPSGDLKIVGGFNVSANSTSVAMFDFLADHSLHVTGNGKYILAPVVHLQTKEGATVDASDANDVKVSGGKVDTDTQVGMDENGTVGVGVSIPADADVEIDNSGAIHVGPGAVGSNMSGNGRVVVGVKDKTANMSSVSSVNVTISSVSAQSAGGWTTLTSTPMTFDLLKLNANGSEALLADVNVTSGTYEQIRLEISSVTVTDANGTHVAKLPSGDLRLIGPLVVNANSTSTVTFDFLANESLHVTGNGEYILAPVVHLTTTENSTVEVDQNGSVHSSAGKVDADVKEGMDENGTVGVGVEIPADADVSVDGSGHISVGQGNPHVPPLNVTPNVSITSGY